MIKNKFAAFGLFVVSCLLIWNLFDFLYATFLTKSGYHFSAGEGLLSPLVVAIVVGYILYLRKKKE